MIKKIKGLLKRIYTHNFIYRHYCNHDFILPTNYLANCNYFKCRHCNISFRNFKRLIARFGNYNTRTENQRRLNNYIMIFANNDARIIDSFRSFTASVPNFKEENFLKKKNLIINP